MIPVLFSLLGAWILKLFGLHTILIMGVYEFFGITISLNGYYFLFFIKGMLAGALYSGMSATKLFIKKEKEE